MGIVDKFKENAEELKDKATDLIDGHTDQVAAGLEKVGDVADKATGGKFDNQIDKGIDVAKDALEELDTN